MAKDKLSYHLLFNELNILFVKNYDLGIGGLKV